MNTALHSFRHTVEACFWRGTAAAVGFAAHHRRRARLIPIAVLAAAAFFVGRLAGVVLLNGF